jgi:hypothetical protein
LDAIKSGTGNETPTEKAMDEYCTTNKLSLECIILGQLYDASGCADQPTFIYRCVEQCLSQPNSDAALCSSNCSAEYNNNCSYNTICY